jgi:uncharacterized membrane protein
MLNYKKILYCLFCGLVLAALLHVIIILVLPNFSQNNAWYRISKNIKPYTFTLLSNKRFPDGRPLISGQDPLFISAVCWFDLNDGPLKIEAKGYAPYWSLSIYDNISTNHYSLNDRNTNPQHLNALIINDVQEAKLEENQTKDTNQISIKVTFKKGLAVFRALRPDATWDKQITEFIKSGSCRALSN